MELWGGHECTVNRVADRYRDQTRLTGHQDRIEDLSRFAALGITRLRYPVLWERVAPDDPAKRDWRWSDERLATIAQLGMTPIVGLLHHGSGPHYTSLVADDFPALFTAYASAAAERYPHVTDWTPINEPLTTARFSALYGLWHPHARDERLFWHALLNQVEATRGAMRAIRRVTPAARLIQTEDLGQYYATEPLAGPAEHLNHRRWMTWDLLAGRVTREHALWAHLDGFGLADRLRAIADDPCPPDMIGVNFYPTSERFIDHRLARYALPRPEAGYHDLAAARVLTPPAPGLTGLLRQTWQRYGLPIAVTESHLGCTREEQLRWLWQSWQACAGVAAEGADVRALTAWALLGNVDWNSLITAEAGHYEPGAFDAGDGSPRPTAIATLLRALARDGAPPPTLAPVLGGAGWWQRDIRLEHDGFIWSDAAERAIEVEPGAPILITGAGSVLARAVAGACDLRGLAHVVVGDDATALDNLQPWAVVDAESWNGADEHGAGARALAEACAERGIRLATFERSGGARWAECDDALVIRTGTVFSPYDEENVARWVERALRSGRRTIVADGEPIEPSYLPDVVRWTLDLLIDGERGRWHLCSGEPTSRLAFARMVAEALELDARLLMVEPARPVLPHPEVSVAPPGRTAALPPLADALARYAAVRRAALPTEAARQPSRAARDRPVAAL